MNINALQNYYHDPKIETPCYIVNITASHSIFQSPNPLSQALPILATQIAIVMLVTHALHFLLRPFNIPRIVSYILGGLLIGPTALSRLEFFATRFPLRSVLVTETVAYWALTCHMFLVGLEMDVNSILRTSKKAIKVALTGTMVPFVIGIALFFIMNHDNHKQRTIGCLFYGGALAMTGFAVVANILSDVRLIHTEIGRISISVSVFSEMISWVLLVVLVAARKSFLNVIFTLVASVGFTVFCVLIVRPFISFIIKKTSKEDNYSGNYLCYVLVTVSILACCSEILGTNSIYGAFIFGLIMPDRVLASVLLEKFEDIISAYLLPLFFAACGLRIDLLSISDWGTAVIVIILACAAKLLGIFLSVFFYKIQLRECFALGVLMNGKGILAMVLLKLANDGKFINERDFTVLVLAILIMSGVIAPIIGRMYRPAKRLSHYKRRTIQKVRKNSEFRILTCFYDIRTVLGMIHLLDCSNPTKESPLSVFALHLVELTGRASATIVVNSLKKKSSSSKDPNAEKIATALETYENLNDNVSIQHLTAFSPFPSMHEDVCSLAEDKHVGFLILPFHKPPTDEGNFQEGKTAHRGVNLNVLPNAPCSVGIFVDRGFGAIHEESNLRMRQLAMLFVGGPDDREALFLAWRMAGTHGIALTVVRFIAGEGADLIEPFEIPGGSAETQMLLSSITFVDKQRTFDDEYINEFRLKTAEEEFITYQEKMVNNDEETVEALKQMHHTFDLYIVGKGEGIVTPITVGLVDWCEFPELGPMGDLLVTSSFAQGSVLVVQKYSETIDGASSFDHETTMSRTPDRRASRGSQQFGSWDPEAEDEGFEMEPFATHK